jgi:hypothetical protein
VGASQGTVYDILAALEPWLDFLVRRPKLVALESKAREATL